MAAEAGDHLLVAAPRMWSEMRAEFDEARTADVGAAEESTASGTPPDELKKVAKWLEQTVTKLGACAAVATDIKKELQSTAEEVIKAFTATLGTLLSLRRGASASLLTELRTAGADLAGALGVLGEALGTPAMAVSAGKVLDRVKVIERTSTNNRAAIRRRILVGLSQIRDAHRELSDALSGDDRPCGESDEEDEIGGIEEMLEPGERRIVEALVAVGTSLSEALAQASQSCMPSGGPGGASISVDELEAAASGAGKAAEAMDGLAAHAMGGLEVDAFSASFEEFCAAVAVLCSAATAVSGNTLEGLARAREGVQVAFLAASSPDAGAAAP